MFAGRNRLLPSVTVGAVCTLASGYAVSELTSGITGWWWALVGGSLVGLIAATFRGHAVQSRASERKESALEPGVARSARGVRVFANNDSVAAWQVDTTNKCDPPETNVSADDRR
jgi:hypothetical protein